MANHNRKPDAVRRNKLQVVSDQPLPVLAVPEPPEKLSPAVLAWWQEYWLSDLARATHAISDVFALRRLAKLYVEVEQMRADVDQEPFVLGSQGQDVRNPLAREIPQKDTEIRQLEDRFGLNPRSRLALGLTLGQVKKQLADLSAPDTAVSVEVDLEQEA